MEKKIEVGKGTFIVRPYRADDEDKVLELWKIAFNKELPLALWRWKYIDNPFGPRILLCVDEKDEAVTVMYGGIPYRANWRGRVVEIVQLMDIMSHPDYRKTGLFVKSADAYFDYFGEGEDSVLLYGFPGAYHFDIGNRYLKYTRVESGMGYYSAETDRLASATKIFAGKMGEVKRVDASFDRLWEKTRDVFPLSVVRDREFLDWRFFSHPAREYSLLAYRTPITGELAGYAVLSIEGEEAKLVDLLAPSGSPDFFGRIGRWLKERGVARVSTWLPSNHFMATGAVDAGFESLPEPLGLIPTVRSFDEGLELDWVSNNLYYTMADCDLY